MIDDKGSYNSQSGCYDDRVMAYAIATHGLASMPRPRHLTISNRFKTLDPVVGY